jgi:hypothetical protein
MRGAHEETSDRMKSARVGILILILIICGAVKPSSTENHVASAAAAAGPKPPEHAAKVKGANEVNRRLMALSEEDRRSVFSQNSGTCKRAMRRDHAHLLSAASEAMERTVSWRPLIRHRGGGTEGPRGRLKCGCGCARYLIAARRWKRGINPHCMNDPQPEGHMASYIGRRKFLATLLGGVKGP